MLTAKKPVLLVGSGVRAAGAASLVVEFAHKTHIPVLTTMNAVDLAQDDLHIGFIGTYGNRAANMILSECDLVISVGARLGLRQIGHIRERFAPKARLIRADIDQSELSRDIKPDEEKHLMDAKDFMQMLLSKPLKDFSEWNARCMEVARLLASGDDTEGNIAVKAISNLLPANPVVTVDVGQHQVWCAQSLHLRGHEGRILIGGGYGSMGCALPYAIGAAISRPTTPIYCIAGDGGLQMNLQELETIRREQLPVKILVINNRALGKISEIQQCSLRGRYAQTTAASGYTVPSFERIAQAYGLRAVSLHSSADLAGYSPCLADAEPCLIDIPIPEDTLLIPKIKWETGHIEPPLTDAMRRQVDTIIVSKSSQMTPEIDHGQF